MEMCIDYILVYPIKETSYRIKGQIHNMHTNPSPEKS